MGVNSFMNSYLCKNTYYTLMFFIAFAFKGQVHVCAGQVNVLQGKCNIENFLSPVKDSWFEPYWRHCVVPLRKTLYSLLSIGSTRETSQND